MKNIIILMSLFVYSFNCFAQVANTKPVLEGFLGIKFGSSQEEVRNVMLTKQGFKYNSELSDNNRLIFGEGMFAGNYAENLAFVFVNNKFYTSILIFKPSSSSKILELYQEIVNGITKKYFKPDVVKEEYLEPYKKDDGFFESAIKLEKTNIRTQWLLKNPITKDDDSFISVKVDDDMKIYLGYMDGYLMYHNDKKDNSDY